MLPTSEEIKVCVLRDIVDSTFLKVTDKTLWFSCPFSDSLNLCMYIHYPLSFVFHKGALPLDFMFKRRVDVGNSRVQEYKKVGKFII